MKKQETGRFLLLIFTLILLINTLNASFVTTLEEVSNPLKPLRIRSCGQDSQTR